MSTQTIQTAGVGASPRVNLMPPEIAEAQRFRQLQLLMGGAIVVSVLAVGFLYNHAKGGISSAQNDLAAAQDAHSALQTKLSSLSDVSATYAQVTATQQLLSNAMAGEIRWSFMLNDLSFRVPSNVWLTGITANETVPGATATGASDTTLTGTEPTAGSVTFTGVAFKHDDVAAWLDSLAKEKGFANPSFSSSTKATIGTRPVVDFGSSTDLTPTILSNRYVAKASN